MLTTSNNHSYVNISSNFGNKEDSKLLSNSSLYRDNNVPDISKNRAYSSNLKTYNGENLSREDYNYH